MFNASRTPAARAAWWLAIPISASLGAGALAQQPSASGSSPQVHQAEVAGAAGISAQMKADRRLRPHTPSVSALAGLHVALLFEKPSLRTRSTFEIAVQTT